MKKDTVSVYLQVSYTVPLSDRDEKANPLKSVRTPCATASATIVLLE